MILQKCSFLFICECGLAIDAVGNESSSSVKLTIHTICFVLWGGVFSDAFQHEQRGYESDFLVLVWDAVMSLPVDTFPKSPSLFTASEQIQNRQLAF